MLIGALVGGLARPVLSPILGGALSLAGAALLVGFYRYGELALHFFTLGGYQEFFEGGANLLLWMALVGVGAGAFGAILAHVTCRQT